MSSYFDTYEARVRDLGRSACEGGHLQDPEAFLKQVQDIEFEVVKDCELFAGDMETPEDARQAIMAVIALKHIRLPRETLAGRNDPARYIETCLWSQFLCDMHGLFHDIARMRYQMRYGLVSDDPRWAVERRDRQVEERDKNHLPHPFQTTPPSEKPRLVIQDGPAYCRTVVARVHGQTEACNTLRVVRDQGWRVTTQSEKALGMVKRGHLPEQDQFGEIDLETGKFILQFRKDGKDLPAA